FFFFQAEDGIRDFHVTGVQTCALPIFRSSTLLTDEGTRVIIPNGDLLSGRLVNWTFSESDIRVNLTLTVDGSIPITEFKQELEAKIIRFEEVDRTIPVKIFTKEITADNYQLIIQVGVR